jgi:uncharacterized protein DUF4410
MSVKRLLFAAFLMATVLTLGCARTDSHLSVDYGGATQLPRPSVINVHQYRLNPASIQLDESVGKRVTRRLSDRSVSQEQHEVAAAIQQALTERLAEELQALGLPARPASEDTSVSSGSVLDIEGVFGEVSEGFRARRLLIGLGTGSAEVNTTTRAYVRFASGRKLVQEVKTTAKSSRKPGVAVSAGAGAAADRAATSAAVAGATGVVAERRRNDVESIAEAAAKEIVNSLRPFLERQGWVPPK